MDPFLAGFADELVKLGALTDGLNSGEGAGANMGEMGTGTGTRRFLRVTQVRGNALRRRRRFAKQAASRKNPYASVQNQADKLLRGNLSDYIGTEEVRHPAHPPMYETSNQAYKDRVPKLDFRPPKPPK